MRSILLRLESERTEDKARSVFQVGYNQRDIEEMDLHRSNIEYVVLSTIRPRENRFTEICEYQGFGAGVA